MRTALSAVALGASLACACHLASAQTVTVTQQGVGNTSSTEQIGLTPPSEALIGVNVTITQVGDNNHVGGPGAAHSGVLQRDNRFGGTLAVVEQYGSGNNAGIIQDGTNGNRGAFAATITQRGAFNDATIRQNIAQMAPATIEQNGIGNLARVEQMFSVDTGVRATQNGTGNQLMIRQFDATFYGPDVTQNGEGNSALVVSESSPAGGPVILQTGTMNSVSTYQVGGFDSSIRLGQLGASNRAEVNQFGEAQRTSLDQNGSNNFASVTQSHDGTTFFGNTALIAQLGNSNTAFVRQVGEGYIANVNQTGSRNWTSIYQH